RIVVAPVSSRNRISLPAIFTRTMGSTSHFSIGISSESALASVAFPCAQAPLLPARQIDPASIPAQSHAFARFFMPQPFFLRCAISASVPRSNRCFGPPAQQGNRPAFVSAEVQPARLHSAENHTFPDGMDTPPPSARKRTLGITSENSVPPYTARRSSFAVPPPSDIRSATISWPLATRKTRLAAGPTRFPSPRPAPRRRRPIASRRTIKTATLSAGRCAPSPTVRRSADPAAEPRSCHEVQEWERSIAPAECRTRTPRQRTAIRAHAFPSRPY